MMIQTELPKKAQAIAAAALDAIHEKGLDRVKLTDVARKAGVTTGAVTYYFEDKDAVLIAAFEESWRQLFRGIEAYEGGWEIERFLNCLPTTDQRRRGWSVWLAFCGRAQTSTTMNDLYRQAYAKLETLILCSAGLKESERSIVREAIAALDGVGLCATLNPDLWPAKQQRSCLRTLLTPLFPSTDC
ncbi:MAG: TetR family transcriptional regulator [Rhodobiaceae bacterium]|nr:TetR family transcriptional regulator [Rhodobiaceae bacterium]